MNLLLTFSRIFAIYLERCYKEILTERKGDAGNFPLSCPRLIAHPSPKKVRR